MQSCSWCCAIVLWQSLHAHHRFTDGTAALNNPGVQPQRADNYLSRSSEILVNQLKSSASLADERHEFHHATRTVDRRINILLDMQDTRFVLKRDTAGFHRVSKHLFCSDKFLWGFMAAVLHPDTKGAQSRVVAMLHGTCSGRIGM